jgi:hypothetical protein
LSGAPSRNSLADETSPYLLQHRDNPVHWQPWGKAALDRARAEDKPILLSVGYAACHWCHVMAHESFENQGIAALMNERFVSIKVDREERPDLDAIYQHALQLLGEQGGWPLTMFLTPAGEPFWGGTYFPPEPRWGRPSFPQVLSGISDLYAKERGKVSSNVEALRAPLRKLASPEAGRDLSPEIMPRVAEGLLRAIDGLHGGIGEAPKFPQVPLFELIWRGWQRSGNEAMRDATLLTLDHISQGGIYDHLRGGSARYSTDARWLAPHFEKMLYDNALLIGLLTKAWRLSRNPLYAERIAETVGWLEAEMILAEGGFASSLDADSEHEEGKFYVWSESQIDAALGPRAQAFKAIYDVSPGGNWEGKTILNRLTHIPRLDEAAEAALAQDRAVLLAARAKRIRPGLDDKALADWNGMMIAALAEAAVAFERPDWLQIARRAFAFVVDCLGHGDGLLRHSFRAGNARNQGLIDDYAQMTAAALALFEASGEQSYLARAKAWVAAADAHYWDKQGGGYFIAAEDAEGLILRAKQAADGPTPSGNGTMAAVLARLFYLTGEDAYRRRAEDLFKAFAGEATRNPFGHASLLTARDLMDNAVQLAIIGRRGDADTDALLRMAAVTPAPPMVLAVVAPQGDSKAGELAPSHPALGKSQIDSKATAYLCRGPTCSLPMTDPQALAEALSRR